MPRGGVTSQSEDRKSLGEEDREIHGLKMNIHVGELLLLGIELRAKPLTEGILLTWDINPIYNFWLLIVL
jgi:hypothetical protein